MAPPASPSDEDLMARIADGDRDAFAQLYRRRRPDVFRFAVHSSGSRTIAEDVTQDVFMAVIHQASRYQATRSSARAWLLGIARNHVRRARARPAESSLDDAGSPWRSSTGIRCPTSPGGGASRPSSARYSSCPRDSGRQWCCATWRN
jgi:hypothetical protein